MKCRSCEEVVDAKFKHALLTNVCPLCGSDIMDKKLQNVIAELKIAFDDAKEYMEEVEDWLFSNFSFKRLKEDEVVVNKDQIKGFKTGMGKGVSVNRSGDDNNENAEGSEEQTIFAKRAGVSVKKAVDFIKGRSSGAADPSEFVGVDDEYGEVNNIEENNAPLNKNELNKVANLFGGEDDNLSQELELQKLKKMRMQVGGASKFSRSE